MRPALRVLVLLLGSTLSTPLAAQRIQPFPYRPWVPQLADVPAKAPAPDYRWEGMKAGGVVGLLFGAYYGHGMCEFSDRADKNCTLATIGGALVVGVLGAGMGGLIGGMIPKTPPDSTGSP
jgi:hypothetical protein